MQLSISSPFLPRFQEKRTRRRIVVQKSSYLPETITFLRAFKWMRYMSNDFSAVSGTNPEYGHFGYLLLLVNKAKIVPFCVPSESYKIPFSGWDFFCPSINDRHDFWLPVNTVDADLWLCQQSSSLSPSIWLLLGIFTLPIRVITIIIIITILKIKGSYHTHFIFSMGAESDSWMMSWGGLDNVKMLLQNFCWALLCTISQVQ